MENGLLAVTNNEGPSSPFHSPSHHVTPPRHHNRPVSFAGTGLDEVDGSVSYFNGVGGRPITAGATTSASSHGGGRQMTFRDYGERIKELEGENFQLKVRLHLLEQSRYGKRSSSSNNTLHQGQNSSSGHDGLTVATNEIVTEFQKLKKDNEALNIKLVTAENQRLKLEEEKEEILRREELQLIQNEELNRKLDVLDRELSLAKLKKDEDDEIEKCVKAFNSFGGGNGNSAYTNNNNLVNPTIEQNNILQATNEKLESQIQSLKSENESLQSEIHGLRQEVKKLLSDLEKISHKEKKRREEIKKLRDDNFGLNVKVANTCETLKELGFQCNEIKAKKQCLEEENEMMQQTISSQSKALEQAEQELNHLKREQALLRDKAVMSDKLQREYGKLVAELKTLRAVCPVDETYERFVTIGLTRSVSHQEIREDPSPDLGIETDQEALGQLAQLGSLSVGNVVPETSTSKPSSKQRKEDDIEELKRMNKQLATKLKQTKQALDTTVTKLEKTTKEKDEFQKAICRQLHKTHDLLEDAQSNLEQQQNAKSLLCGNSMCTKCDSIGFDSSKP